MAPSQPDGFSLSMKSYVKSVEPLTRYLPVHEKSRPLIGISCSSLSASNSPDLFFLIFLLFYYTNLPNIEEGYSSITASYSNMRTILT